MLSIGTNVLLHTFNEDSPRHAIACAWLRSIGHEEEVAISEFILAELYVLLRNPAVLKHPLTAEDAVEVVLPRIKFWEISPIYNQMCAQKT